VNGNSRKNLLILALTLAVIALGYGMVMPIFPFYIERMGISGGAYGLLIASYALMQLIFAPLWGSLSDRTGRKPVLAAGLSALCLLLILAFLPESLPPAARVAPSAAAGRPGLLRPADLWRSLNGPLGLLLFLAFLVSFGMTNFQAIFGLYAVEKYGYGAARVGTILMVVALLAAVGQGLLTGPPGALARSASSARRCWPARWASC
jgi:MFS family permease